jgi:hypothetical protein
MWNRPARKNAGAATPWHRQCTRSMLEKNDTIRRGRCSHFLFKGLQIRFQKIVFAISVTRSQLCKRPPDQGLAPESCWGQLHISNLPGDGWKDRIQSSCIKKLKLTNLNQSY